MQQNSIDNVQQEQNNLKSNHKLKIVNANLKFPRVHLKPPLPSGYLLIALEIDDRGPFFLSESKRKKQLLKSIKESLRFIKKLEYVLDANIFKARLLPPGISAYLKRQSIDLRRPKYDIVVLIETVDYNDISKLNLDKKVVKLKDMIISSSEYYHIASAKNIKRMDSVDHKKQGVFLFNFFYADDVNQNLEVWEYTAGWFEYSTKLNNSTLLQPQRESNSPYSVINHCRWDKMIDILPSLLFKKTLNTYVLANFEANNTVAMPILYKLA